MLIYYYLDQIIKKRYSSAHHYLDLITEISSRYGIREKQDDKTVNKNEIFKVLIYTLSIPQKIMNKEFSSEAINVQPNKWPLFFKNFVFKNLRIPLYLPAAYKTLMQFHELPVLRPVKNFVTVLNIPSYTNLILPDFFNRKVDSYSLVKELNVADIILAPCEYTRQELINRLFVREKKIHVLPLGLPECFFVSPAAPKIKLPEKYLLFTGKITMYKNLERLIRIFNKVAPKNFSLVIVGDIDTRYETLQHALEYKNELFKLSGNMRQDRIIFTGYIERMEIASILKNCSGLIDPSYHNSFPDSVLEAQALGVPVAVSDIPQHREFLKETALYFMPASDQSLGEAVEALASGTSGSDRERIDAGKLLAGKYAWNKVVDQYADFYKSLG
jgi:glycosyltransferase involved in cell wall biosynthesis